jgi:ribonuclease R
MIPELGWLAEHASFMEREAEMAENDSTRYKLTELMGDHIDEVFPGLITGVANFGLFVQLDNTAEGLVHVDSLPSGPYRYDGPRHVLASEKKSSVYRLGERVTVRVVSVSLADSRIDMELA